MAAPHTPEPQAVDPLRNPERRRRAAQQSATDIACGAQSDSYVLPAAHAAAAPYIAAARVVHPGPLPPVRSEEWLDAPDAVKLASLLVLGVAYLIADPHRVVRNALKQVGDDIHGGDVDFWRRWADTYVSNDELERRRAMPAYPHPEAQRDDVA